MHKPSISILSIDLGAGGAEKVISLFLHELTLDYHVTLVLITNDIHFEIPETVEVIHFFEPEAFRGRSLFQKTWVFYQSCLKYGNLIKKKRIQTSVSFLPLPNIINGVVSMRFGSLKSIISERGFPSALYKSSKLTMFLAKLTYPIFYNRNRMLFSNSEYINEDLKTHFGIRIPMHVIYNPIALPKQTNSTINYQAGMPLKIITVGRCRAVKNQALLLDAVAHLEKNTYHLTVVGTGDLDTQLKLQSQSLGIAEHTHFTGNSSDVNGHLAKHHCFALTSNSEGFPNVVLEAMAMGLPIVSTNCMSGPLELLNNNEPVTIAPGAFYEAHYGILINVKDQKALTKALQYYKTHPERLSHYSQQSLKRAQDYATPTIYKQLKQLING